MDDWPPDELSEDEAYELVAEALHRETLHILLNGSEKWDVSSLATKTVAREADAPFREANETDQKRVMVALLHRDFPKLADAESVTDQTPLAGDTRTVVGRDLTSPPSRL